jgi:hypothetical protein
MKPLALVVTRVASGRCIRVRDAEDLAAASWMLTASWLLVLSGAGLEHGEEDGVGHPDGRVRRGQGPRDGTATPQPPIQ